ncbi:MAG: AAA family ATPase [Desulfomonile tiedjei]|nr:AAA family ATPase [Desulfomonile tiedjei]
MWIEEIFLENFGAYKRLPVRDLTPGMNVIIGPNEAGKSTILEFVRGILFGFRVRGAKLNTYEPVDGGSRKGWIRVCSPDGRRLRMQRVERRGNKGGELTVSDDRGHLVDPSMVPQLRTGRDRGAYERLFAVDLDQMRHLDRETLRGKVRGAALGSLEVNPLEVVCSLQERLKTLGKRSVKDAECLYSIRSQIREVDKRLKTLDERPAVYSALKQRSTDVEKQRAALSDEMGGLADRSRQLSRWLRYENEWKRFVAADREMADLADARNFPAEGVARLEQTLERRREADQARAEIREELAMMRNRLEELVPDEAVIARGDAIRALFHQARLLGDRPALMQRTRSAIVQGYAHLDGEIAGLGQGWDRDRLARSDPSVLIEHRIRRFADAWTDHCARIRDAETRLLESSEALKRLTDKAALRQDELQQIVPQCRDFLEPESHNALLAWKEIRANIEMLEHRQLDIRRSLEGLAADAKEIDAKRNQLAEDTKSPLSPIAFWGAASIVATASTAMLVQGWFADGGPLYLHAVLGFVLLACLPAGIAWKVRWERMRTSRIHDEATALARRKQELTRKAMEIEVERRALVERRGQFVERMEEIAEPILGSPHVSLDQVRAAEGRSAAAERWVRRRRVLEASIQELESDLEVERKRNAALHDLLDRAAAGFGELKEQWATFLGELELAHRPEPEEALDLVRRLRDLKERLGRVVQQEAELASMEEEWHDFTARVETLGAEIGRSPGNRLPLEVAEEWSRLELENREDLAEKRALMKRAEAHELRLVALQNKVDETEGQIAALLEAARVLDEEVFRDTALRHARWANLGMERALLLEGLLAGLACSDEAALHAELLAQDWENNRDEVATVEARLSGLRLESEELAATSGRLRHEIEQLETEEETEKLLGERERLNALLQRATREWTILKLACGLLEKTLRLYESEKQPALLARASALCGNITGGAVSKLLFPLDANDVFVERVDGSRIIETFLSRGTLEQVYLSLRLAYLEVYHQGDLALPLMMDDVLVNFDPDRAFHAAHALTRFSEEARIQVLLLTCHPQVARWFPSSATAIDLPLAQGDFDANRTAQR